MRVLIFHGYLLRGTGSNIYNANLAQALARLGHEVHLLCQERQAGELGWVDGLGRWEGGKLRVERLREPAGAGSVTAYIPEIGGLLPVYVRDAYEGFEVKTFPELSEAELRRYLEVNVAAVADVGGTSGGPDAVLANHLVMGPAIVARAGVGEFAVKVHGSALEYTVKPNPRFLPHAREGAVAASCVLVGSRHTAESLWAALPDLDLEAKTRLGPPGVDTQEFAPANRDEAPLELARLATSVEERPAEAFGRSGERAAAALRKFAAAEGPRVLFVGKLIVSKGIDLLLACWPMVRRKNPGARLLVVGFGAYDEPAQRLVAALRARDLDALRELAAAGRALEGAEGGPLPILSSFLEDPPPGYLDEAPAAAAAVDFAGRLDHDEVARLLPFCDALVMPSTFPEAFGMVAVEAAACGVLPVSAAHSGMLEVSRLLATALPPEVGGLLSFDVEQGAVEAIAARLDSWLALDEGARSKVREALVARTRELWSWEGVARGVIAASRGQLGELPPPDV
jgi:glycosyltransferase involved in cell wall biosynthesis